MTAHYTHIKNGGLYHLLQSGITVDGLDVELIQYQSDGSDQPQLMADSKWQAEYRPINPLECHYCAGTGIDPKKTKAPCGWCHGVGLLDAKGDALTRDNDTADALHQMFQELNLRAERAEHQLQQVLELPGVKEIVSRVSAEAMCKQVYQDNNYGPMGQAYRGD